MTRTQTVTGSFHYIDLPAGGLNIEIQLLRSDGANEQGIFGKNVTPARTQYSTTLERNGTFSIELVVNDHFDVETFYRLVNPESKFIDFCVPEEPEDSTFGIVELARKYREANQEPEIPIDPVDPVEVGCPGLTVEFPVPAHTWEFDHEIKNPVISVQNLEGEEIGGIVTSTEGHIRVHFPAAEITGKVVVK